MLWFYLEFAGAHRPAQHRTSISRPVEDAHGDQQADGAAGVPTTAGASMPVAAGYSSFMLSTLPAEYTACLLDCLPAY